MGIDHCGFCSRTGKGCIGSSGNINQPCSYGTNNLIKEGAKLVMNVEDILKNCPVILCLT